MHPENLLPDPESEIGFDKRKTKNKRTKKTGGAAGFGGV